MDQWLADGFELYQLVNLSGLSAGADSQMHHLTFCCLHGTLFLLLTTSLAVQVCATT